MFRNQRFNVFTFLFGFGLLYYSYVFYIGLVSPGGKWYSPFLDRYANVPVWLTYFISSSAKNLLTVAGYAAYQKAPNNVTIQGSPGVTIIWACLGFGVMSFWTAFVVAHKASVMYKLKWWMIGTGLTVLINIIRIASIAVANHYHWNRYRSVEPHLLFNVVSYIIIIALAILFAYRYQRHVVKLKQYKGGNHKTADNYSKT